MLYIFESYTPDSSFAPDTQIYNWAVPKQGRIPGNSVCLFLHPVRVVSSPERELQTNCWTSISCMLLELQPKELVGVRRKEEVITRVSVFISFCLHQRDAAPTRQVDGQPRRRTMVSVGEGKKKYQIIRRLFFFLKFMGTISFWGSHVVTRMKTRVRPLKFERELETRKKKLNQGNQKE